VEGNLDHVYRSTNPLTPPLQQDFKEYNKGRDGDVFPYLLIGNKVLIPPAFFVVHADKGSQLDLADKRQISKREAQIWYVC